MTQQEKLNRRLFEAVIDNDLEAVERAFEDGADVRSTDIDGWTPFHMAAHEGNHETLKLLIKLLLNTRTKFGHTPLDLAEEHTETANLIKQHGGV